MKILAALCALILSLSLLTIPTSTRVKAVAARVYPTVVFVGGSVRLDCRVQPDNRNRFLNWGIPDYRISTNQLDGENARVTWEQVIAHVPCDSSAVVCEVTQNDGSRIADSASLEVAGCERP